MGSTKPCLDRLPYELLLQILGYHQSISQRERISLRSVCHSLCLTLTPVVFHTVVCSRLARDKRAFFGVASSPHLAVHVKTLAWDELDLDGWEPEGAASNYASGLPRYPGVIEDDGIAIWKYMEEAASDSRVFWQPRLGAVSEETRSAFFSALQAMPHLETLVSRPMPAARRIPWEDYPISAGLYQSKHCYNERWENCNDGLFYYLLPAMRRSKSTVKNLHWADEGLYTSLRRLDPTLFEQCFRDLHSVDICLSGFKHHSSTSISDLAANLTKCLQAATGLGKLKLCFEININIHFHHRLAHALFDNHWGKLSALTLLDVHLPEDLVVTFIRRHRESLRHLKLRDSPLTWAAILTLRGIDELKLNSIEISQMTLTGSQLVSETDLLAFINQNASSCPSSDGYFSTTDGDSDGNGGVQNATSSTSDRLYTVVTSVTCCGRTDANHFLRGIEDELSDDESEVPQYVDGNRSRRFVRPDHEVGSNHDWPPEMWPRWNWDRFGTSIWYWQVEENTPGVPTSIWRYDHRDGRRVFGGADLEIFEYFSDWDSEAGDEVSPTPYGGELETFVSSQPLHRGPVSGHTETTSTAMLYNEDEDPCYNGDLQL